MTTVMIHPHRKFSEIAKRLLAGIHAVLRHVSASKLYHPEAHYMRGKPMAEIKRMEETGDGPDSSDSQS